MPTIDQFASEPKYTIKAVCAETGIRPVTLRAWERRHEVLSPYRAENQYRLYSERDVAILRWIKNRVDNGTSISSAVSELQNMRTRGLWPDAIPAAPKSHPGTSGRPPEQYAKALFNALIKHDEARAGDILREAHALFDLKIVFTYIITPALVEIGEAWYRGQIRVTTEHFASTLLRGKLLSLIQAYPSRHSAPFVLVGCGPTEQHEIGSLMLAVLLRHAGFRVEYLGPDIPLDDLVDYASYERPAMIILSATSESAAMELKNLQGQLDKVRNRPIFGFGGRAFNLLPALRTRIPGVFLGETLDASLEHVVALLGHRHRA